MEKSSGASTPRPALGKGLASLLANAPQSSRQPALGGATMAATTDAVSGRERIPGITMADIDQIVPNQFQPRRDFEQAPLEELAASIRANGIIQPLVVRRGDDGKLHLIAGERRLRASKLAGLKQVPIVLRKSSDREALEIALIENVQREDLNCVDIALSYFQLMEDFQLTQEELAGRVGKDRVSIANHLRLLKLPEQIIDDLRSARLSFGHGRALLALSDPLKRIELRNAIIEKHLSVRETERLISELLSDSGGKRKPKSEKRNQAPVAELNEFSERLARALGSRVAVRGDKFKGVIEIQYFSAEDLERIGEQLLR